MTEVVRGFLAMDRRLAGLGLKGREAGKVRRAGANAALGELAKGIRSEVPVGETKTLKKSIGKRFKKEKGGPDKGVSIGKVGVNVAIKLGKQARHSHLIAAGTAARYTTSGAYRGKVDANDFVERGFRKSASRALRKMMEKVRTKLAEVARKR